MESVKKAQFVRPKKCPFCDSDISHKKQTDKSYIDASTIELERIRLQLQDLNSVETVTNEEITSLEEQMNELKNQHNDLMNLVNKKFKPRAVELKATVESYKGVLIYQQELYALDVMSEELIQMQVLMSMRKIHQLLNY